MQSWSDCCYVRACLLVLKSVPQRWGICKSCCFSFVCFPMWLLTWKQNIRNVWKLHSISTRNCLTFAESHSLQAVSTWHLPALQLVTGPHALQLLSSPQWDRTWALMEGHHKEKTSPGTVIVPSVAKFPCSSIISFNHMLCFIWMRT